MEKRLPSPNIFTDSCAWYTFATFGGSSTHSSPSPAQKTLSFTMEEKQSATAEGFAAWGLEWVNKYLQIGPYPGSWPGQRSLHGTCGFLGGERPGRRQDGCSTCLGETYGEAAAQCGYSEHEGYQDRYGGSATKDMSTPFSKSAVFSFAQQAFTGSPRAQRNAQWLQHLEFITSSITQMSVHCVPFLC